MTKHRFVPSLLVASALALGCQRAVDDGAAKRHADLLDKLGSIDKRLEALEKRPAGGAAPPQRARPTPETVYFLPVEADDPVRGAPDARVTIVEAFEFACPYCRTITDPIDQVLAKYEGNVRVVGKQFIVHPQVATLPALAACAANKQQKYDAYERALWTKAWPQREGEPNPRLDREQLSEVALVALAAELRLDAARFKADMNGAECKTSLEKEQQALRAVGIGGTPSIYINGRIFTGQRTLEGFSAAIDAELKRAETAIASGIKPADYYESLMKNAKRTI